MTTLCWLRRDLRLHDHPALSAALEDGGTHLVFVFDNVILNALKDKNDRRITFIMDSLKEIEATLHKNGSSLFIRFGNPEIEIPALAKELKAKSVFCNRDYEPYAKTRDQAVAKKLSDLGIEFHQFKDVVMFEQNEVRTNSGGLYKVFTPYKNRWLELFEKQDRHAPEYHCNLAKLAQVKNSKNVLANDWYKEIGFAETLLPIPAGTKAALSRLKKFSTNMADYKEARNFPAKEGTSGLSPYLRFGNLSVRDMIRAASDKTWLSEIIWRDFYQMILDTHPEVTKGPYKTQYEKIKWKGDPKHFKLWCEGMTGFPLVDAAMRCLNETGLMHNRLRMITASFLCKTLLIDWRLGEQYFAQKLLDFDLAANNGGWQWSASTGTDAQPYFRIFNPYTQIEKFDPDHEFINHWCPDEGEIPEIVSYEMNRARALEMYSAAGQKG